MELIPITTPLLKEGDDLAAIIHEHSDLQDGDIVAISSKAIAVTEGAVINLNSVAVTEEAKEWSEKVAGDQSAAFRQAVLDETKRLHGTVAAHCRVAMLCELKPEGLQEGSILGVNAGLDTSNIEDGFAIGWPHDPVKSAKELRERLKTKSEQLAVIITDSCCRPRRLGVTAMALTVSGMDPLQSQVGKRDLFDTELKMTQEALADQLATAANFLMGNADQSIPAVIIRDHRLPLNDFTGWVPGIDPKEDLFQGLF